MQIFSRLKPDCIHSPPHQSVCVCVCVRVCVCERERERERERDYVQK